jgi:ubiquinone/menaquinone biosynthesis C-methylase UbiE
MTTVKQDVREFYDQVGWQEVSQGLYQNAHYEDLRPVAREYIHRCHLRVARHLKPAGRFLLDAGSGPIQYPEYLEYSEGYQRRVCADISIVALQEARKRIGVHGLFVVADVANLPFKPDAFDGTLSLHTIHHLPQDEQLQAYQELYRTLSPHSQAAVVNGWPASRLMRMFEPLIQLKKRLRRLRRLVSERSKVSQSLEDDAELSTQQSEIRNQESTKINPKGTFTDRHDVSWVKGTVGAHMPVEIRVWRSVSVRWLRNFISPALGGRTWLRLLYALEERFPHFFGENGQYPLIILRKE